MMSNGRRFGDLANDSACHALMKFVRAKARRDMSADLLPLRFSR
jgi:hypothetical protein